MPFTKFPSLESFGHVWRNQSSMMGGPVVRYRAKIKLHGTNAAIRCEGGEVFAQKRTSDITPENDNAGFARWLEPHKNVWRLDPSRVPMAVTYFGEWAGPGVQKGDAVSQLDRKMFFIFAVQEGDDLYVDPDEIESMLPDDCAALDDVMVLPWAYDCGLDIDFSDPITADEIAQKMTEAAEQVGEVDPFIAETFGIEAPGEGHVWVPVSGPDTREHYSAHTFKVKAARHGAKKAKAASRKIEIPEGARDFVEMFVTESRCMQALGEACDGIPEKPRTPDFLKWLGADIKKESEVELLEAGLEWKQVSKLVNAAGVRWFHDRCSRPFSEAA